jgi:hypothetical protein
MFSRSLAFLPSGSAVLFTSLACAAAPPVSPVAATPVAPAASTPKSSTSQPAAAASTPALIAMAPQETPLFPPQGTSAAEGPTVAPALAPAASLAAARIVLVDDLPYHPTHLHTRELPEHGHSRGKKHGRHGRPYHPAPGVVVDALDTQGEIDAADLQRSARNVGYWPFRHCYEEGLRRDQNLSGKVSLDVNVGASGAVERASMASTGLKDESVGLCVAREAAHLTLAPAKGAAHIEVALSTGDERVPEPRPALHARELREALRASWPAVERCYATELPKHPEAGGRLELRFRVKSDGQVVEVAEGDTRFADIDVTRCVLGVYRAATLPALHGGPHETTFAYALHMEARPSTAPQNVSPTAK